MKKGISPLLGALVLVGIVIAVTAIVGPEILDFVEGRTGEATEESIDRIICDRADMSIRNVQCNQYNGGHNLSIEVENTGHQELTDFKIEAHQDLTVHTYSPSGGDEILQPGSTRLFEIDEFKHPEVEEARILSGTCPLTASRTISQEEINC